MRDILFFQKPLNVVLILPDLDNDFKGQQSHDATSDKPHWVDGRGRSSNKLKAQDIRAVLIKRDLMKAI